MRINCPYNWSAKGKAGNMEIEFRYVEVYAWICDYPDKCGVKECPFYDVTREGTRKFMRAQREEYTLEGRRQHEAIDKCFKELRDAGYPLKEAIRRTEDLVGQWGP